MAYERITSAQNPLIRHIRKLSGSRSYRESCGEFVAEGRKLLREALLWYPYITTVLYSEGLELPTLPEHVRCVEVPYSLMESISVMKTPQGILFVCQLPEQQAAVPTKGMLLLDRIQDPGNLGTILRTADAFGIPVLLTNGCADPYSEKTLRASMGAVLRTVPQWGRMEEILAQCIQRGIPIAATALSDRSVDLRKIDLREYLVIIGSEGQGICDALLEAADQQIIIPMEARCESLNAAVAATVVMWQMKQDNL